MSRLYEQLYILSAGCRSRAAVEYSWGRDKEGKLREAFRVPLEMNWGCDFFRVWLLLDFYSEYKERWVWYMSESW
jgi:hypothetical protein